MPDRAAGIAAFLAASGWGAARRSPLAGDASARRYERLALDGRSAVLMDAPGQAEDVARFVRVADWLSARGFSAPAILAADEAAGLLILEDLGDALFARLTEADPAQEPALYAAATDFLAALHRHEPPDWLPPLDGPALGDLAALTPEWYLRGIDAAPNAAATRLPALIAATYDRLNREAPVVSLRDFHAENLIWLPERRGPARVGLLDFQDAMAAHPAYDLVSLLQDARRDVSPAVEAAERDRYAKENGLEQSRFSAIYALLGLQRNIRILGVFARLCIRSGKPQYLAHVPRVWGYIERNLAHPALAELAGAARDGLPEPTPARLRRIEEKCGTIPGP